MRRFRLRVVLAAVILTQLGGAGAVLASTSHGAPTQKAPATSTGGGDCPFHNGAPASDL